MRNHLKTAAHHALLALASLVFAGAAVCDSIANECYFWGKILRRF